MSWKYAQWVCIVILGGGWKHTGAISERAQSLRYQNIERLLPPTHSAWAQMCLWANIMLASHLMIMDKACSEFFEQKLPWNLKFKIKLNIPTSYPVLCQLKVPNSNILLLSGIHDGSKKSQIKCSFQQILFLIQFRRFNPATKNQLGSVASAAGIANSKPISCRKRWRRNVKPRWLRAIKCFKIDKRHFYHQMI